MKSRCRRAALLCIAASVVAAGSVWAFSEKPQFIDPTLAGWAAPMRTLCFQAGCGELFYVVGVYLTPERQLKVESRAKVSLRRLEKRYLIRYAAKLSAALRDPVADLHQAGRVNSVLLTFHCPFLGDGGGNVRIFESALPADRFRDAGAIHLDFAEAGKEFP